MTRQQHDRERDHSGTEPDTAIVLSETVAGLSAGTPLIELLQLFAARIAPRVGEGSITANAILKKTPTFSMTLNATKRRNQTGTFTVDSITRRNQPGSFTVDAVIA